MVCRKESNTHCIIVQDYGIMCHCNDADKNATPYAIPPATDPNAIISNKELQASILEIYDFNNAIKIRQAMNDKMDDPSSNTDEREYTMRGIIPNNIKLMKHEIP